MGWISAVERVLEGTPLEPLARRVYKEVASIGRPRARQSLRYDRQTGEVMARVLQPASNCVDVGAHRGSILEDMLRSAPQGRHFAFEPLPDLAARLTRRFPGVQVHQVALSDAAGETTFHHVVDYPGYSGFRRLSKIPPNAEVRELRVRTERLDDVLPPDLPIGFMKIDVEGAQLQVLRGAERTIMRWKPVIVLEHGALAQQPYGISSDMVWDLLTRLGLRISCLGDWLKIGRAHV